MKQINNIITLECDNFELEVKYEFRKGNAGNYYNPPEEDEINIKRIYIEQYTTEEGDIININKRLFPISGHKVPLAWEEIIMQEISYDIENFT